MGWSDRYGEDSTRLRLTKSPSRPTNILPKPIGATYYAILSDMYHSNLGLIMGIQEAVTGLGAQPLRNFIVLVYVYVYMYMCVCVYASIDIYK